ncbi:MAG: CARDB domain-containing protein [Thermoplasmatota archaeon]
MIWKRYLLAILVGTLLTFSALSIGVSPTGALETDTKGDGSFEVNIRLEKRDVAEGEEAVVNYTIENTGGEDTQDIEFTVYFRDEVHYEDVEENLTISAGEKHESQFVWSTEEVDEGRYVVEVASQNDHDDSSLEVLKPNVFAVDTWIKEREATVGEEVVINYEITNTKSEEDTQDIALSVYREDEVVHEDVKKSVTIPSWEKNGSQFVWGTEEGDAGRYVLEVASEDDRKNSSLEVLKPNSFTVNTRLEEREITEGEDAVMNYEITSTKSEEDTQDIEFTVYREDEVVHEDVEKSVTISPDGIHESQFTWSTEEGDAGSYSLEVSIENEKNGHPLEVLKTDAFMVQTSLAEREIEEGDEAVLTYTINNTKTEEETQDIEFTVFYLDEVVHEDVEKGVSVLAGETYEGEFVWSTEEGDAKEAYRLEVASEDDENEERLTVLKAEAFAVDTRLKERKVVEGEKAVINYQIRNTKTGEDTQDIEFTVYFRDEVVHEDVERDVTISPDGIHESQFIWSTEKGDAEDGYRLEVASEDDEDDSRLTVLKTGAFTVQISLEKKSISEGEEAVVNYEIRNTGGEDTQDIEFRIDEEVFETNQDLNLGGNDTYEGRFTWQTEEGDSGDHLIEVASEDDNQSKMLTVEGEGGTDEDEGAEGESPGFTSALLLSALAIAVVIYHKKKR